MELDSWPEASETILPFGRKQCVALKSFERLLPAVTFDGVRSMEVRGGQNIRSLRD